MIDYKIAIAITGATFEKLCANADTAAFIQRKDIHARVLETPETPLCVTPALYDKLKADPDNAELLRRFAIGPDGDSNDLYVILIGDWVELGDDYEAVLRVIESTRHGILSISEEGEIWRDVETCDKDGCDENFDEMFGWTAHICLWQDTSQTLI